MNITVLCPFHLAPLIRAGDLWICPVYGCPYVRIACPSCGSVIRIAPPRPYCLKCGSEFSLEEASELASKALGIPKKKGEEIVRSIYGRYSA